MPSLALQQPPEEGFVSGSSAEDSSPSFVERLAYEMSTLGLMSGDSQGLTMTFAPKCSSDSGASTGDSHTDLHHAMHQLNHDSSDRLMPVQRTTHQLPGAWFYEMGNESTGLTGSPPSDIDMDGFAFGVRSAALSSRNVTESVEWPSVVTARTSAPRPLFLTPHTLCPPVKKGVCVFCTRRDSLSSLLPGALSHSESLLASGLFAPGPLLLLALVERVRPSIDRSTSTGAPRMTTRGRGRQPACGRTNEWADGREKSEGVCEQEREGRGSRGRRWGGRGGIKRIGAGGYLFDLLASLSSVVSVDARHYARLSAVSATNLRGRRAVLLLLLCCRERWWGDGGGARRRRPISCFFRGDAATAACPIVPLRATTIADCVTTPVVGRRRADAINSRLSFVFVVVYPVVVVVVVRLSRASCVGAGRVVSESRQLFARRLPRSRVVCGASGRPVNGHSSRHRCRRRLIGRPFGPDTWLPLRRSDGAGALRRVRQAAVGRALSEPRGRRKTLGGRPASAIHSLDRAILADYRIWPESPSR
uniref:Uncharacterized protein n=1 Tax=Plectus sambesii TaxID=2011161 RepID=A0A914VPK5_9BILA